MDNIGLFFNTEQ